MSVMNWRLLRINLVTFGMFVIVYSLRDLKPFINNTKLDLCHMAVVIVSLYTTHKFFCWWVPHFKDALLPLTIGLQADELPSLPLSIDPKVASLLESPWQCFHLNFLIALNTFSLLCSKVNLNLQNTPDVLVFMPFYNLRLI